MAGTFLCGDEQAAARAYGGDVWHWCRKLINVRYIAYKNQCALGVNGIYGNIMVE